MLKTLSFSVKMKTNTQIKNDTPYLGKVELDLAQ